MNYTENFEGVKIDIQSVDFDLPIGVQQEIRKIISKLKNRTSQINWVDVYFKVEGAHSNDNKEAKMKVGIPGSDVFAEEKGKAWAQILGSIEDKILRQLKKKYI